MPDDSLTPDELASALLDQEANSPADADPARAARIDQFRAVSAHVAAPVTIDPDRREQAIAAALAEFDASRDLAGASVTPIPHRRPVALRLLGAAAAVVVVLGAVTLLRRDETSTTDTATAAAGAATTAASSEGGSERLSGTSDAGGDAAVAAESAPTTQAAFAPGGAAGGAPTEAANDAASSPPSLTASARDLGSVDDESALQSQLDAFAADADATAPSSICEPEARAASTATLGPLVDAATLRWQGASAQALVFANPGTSETVVIVVADPTCEVLAQIA